ncbi:hypothetical protein NQU17_08865 [Clostridiaceae bacterium HFYG-1003]|nr:hypothetical protein NQU17_08865 [Clostridiaceae bacterium HFYG-1003]
MYKNKYQLKEEVQRISTGPGQWDRLMLTCFRRVQSPELLRNGFASLELELLRNGFASLELELLRNGFASLDLELLRSSFSAYSLEFIHLIGI